MREYTGILGPYVRQGGSKRINQIAERELGSMGGRHYQNNSFMKCLASEGYSGGYNYYYSEPPFLPSLSPISFYKSEPHTNSLTSAPTLCTEKPLCLSGC